MNRITDLELNTTLAVMLATLDAFSRPDCNIAPRLRCAPRSSAIRWWIAVEVVYNRRGYTALYGYSTLTEQLQFWGAVRA